MDKSSLDYAGFRHEYIGAGLRRADLDPDPIKEFENWFTAAFEAHILDANAMTVATCADGKPSARVVLLKDFDQRGFVFFTNYASEKGQQLEKNPNVALVFYWMEVERQIRIQGAVEKTSREESGKYFHSRPIGAQLGAWASPQSQVLPSRQSLEDKIGEVILRFGDGNVPRPPNWGGFRLHPTRMEFWQGRPSRLHDRIEYAWAENRWIVRRLAP